MTPDEIQRLAEDEKFWEARRQTNAKKCAELASPSQATAYEECPRRWYGGWVLGLKSPSTQAQRRGTDIHTEVEHYLATGSIRPSPYAALVAAGAEHYPRGARVEIEQWVSLETKQGLPKMRGRFDVLEADPESPLVVDTKSTSDIRRYGKRPEDLPEHLQINMYGMAALERFPAAKNIRARIVHLQTRGAKIGVRVDATISIEQLRDRWRRTIETLGSMADLARELPPFESVMPDTRSCDLYGGCDYRGICGEGGGSSLVKLRILALERDAEGKKDNAPTGTPTEENTVDLLEMMKKEAANGASKKEITAPPTPTPTPAPQAAPEDAPCGTCLGRKWVKNTEKDALPGSFLACAACKGTGLSGPRIGVKGTDGQYVVVDSDPTAVLPPDAPARSSTPEEIQAVADAAEKKPRAKKAKGEAKGEAKAEAAPAPTPPIATGAAPSPSPTPQLAIGRVLLIDTVQTKGPAAMLQGAVNYEEWVEPIARRVSEKNNVADWRLIPYVAEGELAIEIRAAISRGELPAVTLVSGTSRARSPFLESAIPAVQLVFRGV